MFLLNNSKFWQAAEIKACIAGDEMMIPFKGRHSLKVYNRNKPSKWGYKAWALTGGSGYVYHLYLYGDNLVKDAPNTLEDIGESVRSCCGSLNTALKKLKSSLTTSLHSNC